MAQLQEMNKPIRKNPQKSNDRKKQSKFDMPNKSDQLSRKNPLINWNTWVSIYLMKQKEPPTCTTKTTNIAFRQKTGEGNCGHEMTQLSIKITSHSQEATIFQVSPIYIQLSEQISKLVSPMYIQLSEQMSKYSIISDFPCGPLVKTSLFLCN